MHFDCIAFLFCNEGSKMTKLAVVTGATGTVGKVIVTMLLERGYRVRILTRNRSYEDPRTEVVNGDLADITSIETFLCDAEYVFHCVAEKRYSHTKSDHRNDKARY